VNIFGRGLTRGYTLGRGRRTVDHSIFSPKQGQKQKTAGKVKLMKRYSGKVYIRHVDTVRSLRKVVIEGRQKAEFPLGSSSGKKKSHFCEGRIRFFG